jgi:hypothetical protein
MNMTLVTFCEYSNSYTSTHPAGRTSNNIPKQVHTKLAAHHMMTKAAFYNEFQRRGKKAARAHAYAYAYASIDLSRFGGG